MDARVPQIDYWSAAVILRHSQQAAVVHMHIAFFFFTKKNTAINSIQNASFVCFDFSLQLY